jgi:hypothetical protein
MKPVGGSTGSTGPQPAVPMDFDKTTKTQDQATPASESKAKGVPPEVSKAAQDAISSDTTAMVRRAQLQGAQDDLKAKVIKAQSSKLDGAENISKSEYEDIKKTFRQGNPSDESIKWLEKNHPHMHAAIVSDLDYKGYVGTANGSLNLTRAGDELKQDAAKRDAKLDQLPGLDRFGPNGLPNNLPGADPLGNQPDTGKKVNGYKTGNNYTKVIGDDLSNISSEEAKKSREAQTDFTAKMSGVIGTDVPNPPTAKSAKAYFQTMADRGASPDQIKKEYGQYLKTFYRHPGGVDWKPALDPKNVDQAFSQQPVAKDGKRLVDCEGYAALTENVLGGLKGKNGQPMFDIQHGSSDSHVVCGVFPHGGDPRKGFVVDNTDCKDIKFDPRMEKFYGQTTNPEKKMQFLVREHMHQAGEGDAQYYGSDFMNTKRPGEKVKTGG